MITIDDVRIIVDEIAEEIKSYVKEEQQVTLISTLYEAEGNLNSVIRKINKSKREVYRT